MRTAQSIVLIIHTLWSILQLLCPGTIGPRKTTAAPCFRRHRTARPPTPPPPRQPVAASHCMIATRVRRRFRSLCHLGPRASSWCLTISGSGALAISGTGRTARNRRSSEITENFRNCREPECDFGRHRMCGHRPPARDGSRTACGAEQNTPARLLHMDTVSPETWCPTNPERNAGLLQLQPARREVPRWSCIART